MPDPDLLVTLLIAAFIHGMLGFGFPLVATPVLALFMDLRAAVLLTLVPTVSINLVSILGEKHWQQARRYSAREPKGYCLTWITAHTPTSPAPRPWLAAR